MAHRTSAGVDLVVLELAGKLLIAVHRHRHHGGIVHIRVMWIGELECPAAGAHVRTTRDPVAAHVQNLQRDEPLQPLARHFDGALVSRLEQCVRRQRGIPHGRQAGLHIRFVVGRRDQLFDRLAGNGAARMILRVAEHVVHHDRIGHGRINRTEPVLAVEPLLHERHRAIDRLLAQPLRKARVERAQHVIDAREEREPEAALMRGPLGRAHVLRVADEQLVDLHAFRVARKRTPGLQHQQRHDHRARPVRHLRQVEREPLRQQHDFDRHHRHRLPIEHAVQREQDAREDVRILSAPARQNRLAGAHHVRRVDRLADHLQREVRLHARAHVELAVLEQRPAAMFALDATQIGGDLAFEFSIDLLAQMMAQQHVFGRDRRVGLQFEEPVAVVLLQVE